MALRVAILTPWAERLGGAEEMLWLALSRFDRDELQPIVVFMGEGPFEREVAELGIETHTVSPGRLRHPVSTARSIHRIAGILRRARPDVVLNWSAKAQLYGAPAARLAGLGDRVLWWQHQIPDGFWLDRIATLLPAAAIGCSSRAGQVAQSRLAPRRRSFVVHPGIDTNSVEVPGDAPVREGLGIPDGRSVIGIVGRLQPWKGQDRLLKAVAELRIRGHDVHALIVGGDAFGLSPEYAAGLERLIEEEGLSEYVTMTGQVDDSGPYLQAMDVAVNASEEEPFGIVLIEAMAAGVAVVAVAKGGPLDIIEDGSSGVFASSGASVAIADAIEPLIRDKRLRDSVASAGRRRVAERFTARRMADELATGLRTVADAR